LGNLFRRRGEYERAVRVHQHLLSRGDLVTDDRHRAQHALALDYLKAGLLDRAEEALLKLEGTRFEAQARLALLANYERSRDWEHAAGVARKLEAAGQGSFAGRLAHYLCEQAAARVTAGKPDEAAALLSQAISTAPHTPRPRIDMAALQRQQGDHQQACTTLAEAMLEAPAATPLIAPLLAASAIAAGSIEPTLVLMKSRYEESSSIDVLDAIVTLEAATGDAALTARQWYARHLEKEPSLVAAAKWIAGEKLEHEQFHPQVQRALDHATQPLLRYRCAACGFEAMQHFWQCPGCQAWDSYPPRRVEEL
jgi:lipopolysaccharide biosynthesis regulator YciM